MLVDKMLQEYGSFVMPALPVTELVNALKGRHPDYFPLARIKQQPSYLSAIRELLKSSTPNDRMLAYVTLGTAGDTSFNVALLDAKRCGSGASCSVTPPVDSSEDMRERSAVRLEGSLRISRLHAPANRGPSR